MALVGTSLLYALAAVAGIGLSAQAVGVTIFWPAAGVAAAVASASPRRVRPYVIGGVGLGTILSAAPFVDVNWFHAVGAAGANVAEAVVAGAILRARLPQSHRIVRLADIGALLLAALLGVNLLGYVAGDLGARGLRLSPPMRRALTLEVGMQNAGLGTTLALGLFPDRPAVAVPGALYTFGCMLTGTVLASYWGGWAATMSPCPCGGQAMEARG